MDDQFDYLSVVSIRGETDCDTFFTAEADGDALAMVKFDDAQSSLTERELVHILKSCRKARRAYKLASGVEK